MIRWRDITQLNYLDKTRYFHKLKRRREVAVEIYCRIISTVLREVLSFFAFLQLVFRFMRFSLIVKII